MSDAIFTAAFRLGLATNEAVRMEMKTAGPSRAGCFQPEGFSVY